MLETNARSPQRDRGYNLIELLIAMALLGTILMSIITLFFFGRRNVYSGKQLTRATSVTTQVLEDLQPLNVANLNTQFLITSSEKPGTVSIAGKDDNNALLRSTDDLSKEYASGPKYLTRWKALLPAAKIASGRVSLVILPENMFTANDPTTASRVRLLVITEWNEDQRRRNVVADLVKFNRAF
jgi:prepilin-type N-terminal cleavage/methylation domain-containing protein